MEDGKNHYQRSIEAIDNTLILKIDLTECGVIVVLDYCAKFGEITKLCHAFS